MVKKRQTSGWGTFPRRGTGSRGRWGLFSGSRVSGGIKGDLFAVQNGPETVLIPCQPCGIDDGRRVWFITVLISGRVAIGHHRANKYPPMEKCGHV